VREGRFSLFVVRCSFFVCEGMLWHPNMAFL